MKYAPFMDINLRDDILKRAAVLLDFVQIASPPPPPILDNLYNFFWTLKTSI